MGTSLRGELCEHVTFEVSAQAASFQESGAAHGWMFPANWLHCQEKPVWSGLNATPSSSICLNYKCFLRTLYHMDVSS